MAYRFYKVEGPDLVAGWLNRRLESLAKERQSILVLLSGGSAIDLAVKLRQKLDVSSASYCFSLVDERYGPVGHNDSNWAQLEKAGFDFRGVSAHPVLSGKSLDETTESFDNYLKGALTNFGYIAGLFGMGADGHTAGILPGSKAASSQSFVTCYKGPDYQRITTTPKFIAKINEAFLYAMGDNKWEQIDSLKQELPIAKQPAQVLKSVPKLTVFNDHEGGSL